MKFTTALIAILLSGSSFALAQNQPPNQNPQDPNGPTKPPVIYEHAQVKVKIFKNTIVRVGNRFEEHKEDICIKYATIAVPDIRVDNGNVALPAITNVNCQEVLPNKAFDLYVWVFSILERHNGQDYKSYYSSMSVGDRPETNPTDIILPDRAMAATKQIDLKSMIFNFAPKQGIYCMEPGNVKKQRPITVAQTSDNCSIFNPVAYGALVEFESL